MKQTAVDWLVEQMRQPNWMSIPTTEWIQQAKQMEKEQIINAYTIGVEEDIYFNPLKTGEEYYKETYEQD